MDACLHDGSMMNHIEWRFQSEIKVTQHEPRSLRTVQGKGEVGIVVEMSYDELEKEALFWCECAMDDPQFFVNIVHVKQNEYHLEKVLGVYLSQLQAYIGLVFAPDHNGRPMLQRIILDLGDLKRKASLVAPVPENSWLNHGQMTINRLKLVRGQGTMRINGEPVTRYSASPRTPLYLSTSQNGYLAVSVQQTRQVPNPLHATFYSPSALSPTPRIYHRVRPQQAGNNQQSKPNSVSSSLYPSVTAGQNIKCHRYQRQFTKLDYNPSTN